MTDNVIYINPIGRGKVKRGTFTTIDPDVKERKCLKCGTNFMSSWVGNRICSHCKSLWDYDNFSSVGNIADDGEVE